ncbi:MAG: EF-hand domain-containing protein [Pseudomonadota bacterium]|nr:EF-hand domain-containing protein [Pseudomonadota bacterium]
MYKLLIGGAAAAFVALAPATAGTVQPHPDDHQAMMNKTETRAEVQAHISQMFAKLDANKDGYISTAEMDAMQAKQAGRMEQKMEQRAAHFDPAKMFAHLDTNKDGKLTKAEVEAARAARKGATNGHGADRLFAHADTNKDGVITLAELQALPKPSFDKAKIEQRMEGRGHMLGQADLNKDGKVSLAEAQQAALAQFDRVDTNHDGKITPEERKAAFAAMHAQHKG